jgi:hypothetical protein
VDALGLPLPSLPPRAFEEHVDHSTQIIALLIERPHWSNSAIARRVGCEQRRVRRYRRRLEECGAGEDELRALDAVSVRALLNARQRKDTPDFPALLAAHPHATGRALWRAHVAAHLAGNAVPVSYSHFMRHYQEWLLRTAGM